MRDVIPTRDQGELSTWPRCLAACAFVVLRCLRARVHCSHRFWPEVDGLFCEKKFLACFAVLIGFRTPSFVGLGWFFSDSFVWWLALAGQCCRWCACCLLACSCLGSIWWCRCPCVNMMAPFLSRCWRTSLLLLEVAVVVVVAPLSVRCLCL